VGIRERDRRREKEPNGAEWLRQRTGGNFFYGRDIPIIAPTDEIQLYPHTQAEITVALGAEHFPLFPEDSVALAAKNMPQRTVRFHSRSVTSQLGMHIVGPVRDFPNPGELRHEDSDEVLLMKLRVENLSDWPLVFHDGDKIAQPYIENEPISQQEVASLIESGAFHLDQNREGRTWGLTSEGLWLRVNYDKLWTPEPKYGEVTIFPTTYHSHDARDFTYFPLSFYDIQQFKEVPEFYVTETVEKVGVPDGYVMLISGNMGLNTSHISSLVCKPNPEPWRIRLEVDAREKQAQRDARPTQIYATVHKAFTL
jgi:hypothetical protein